MKSSNTNTNKTVELNNEQKKVLLTARNKINKLDKKIIKLLNKRFDVVNNLMQDKTRLNIATTDANREQIIIDSIPNNQYKQSIGNVYNSIFAEGKKFKK